MSAEWGRLGGKSSLSLSVAKDRQLPIKLAISFRPTAIRSWLWELWPGFKQKTTLCEMHPKNNLKYNFPGVVINWLLYKIYKKNYLDWKFRIKVIIGSSK